MKYLSSLLPHSWRFLPMYLLQRSQSRNPLDGERQQTFTLAGPNATVKYLPSLYPNTTLEFRLLAPEPLILEVKEMATDSGAVAAVGKVKLVQTGSSFAMSEIKGAKFRTTYSLVRAN
jgi:hypothetical protein